MGDLKWCFQNLGRIFEKYLLRTLFVSKVAGYKPKNLEILFLLLHVNHAYSCFCLADIVVCNNLLKLLATQARIFYTLVLSISQSLGNGFLKEG